MSDQDQPGVDTVNRSYQFRAYPTAEQAAALDTQLSEACRLFNAAIQERRDAWRMARKSLGLFDQCRQLKDIRAAGDVGIPNFSTAVGVLKRVDRAFAAFFRRVKAGERPGYPRFRSFRRYDSITFSIGNGASLKPAGVRAHGVGIIPFKRHRPIVGTPKQVTFKRDAGRWFVVVTVDCEPEPMPKLDSEIGVDVGLASFATLSDGTEIENPRHERIAARSVRVARRTVARRQRGSSRHQKAAQRLQRALGKVRRQRADFHHKVSRALVNAHGLIAVEDLNIKGLARTRMARSVHDAGWASFITKLAYKAESAGRVLVKVNPAGTSQTCPCGQAVPKTLSKRRHDCPSCGLSTSRDHAAALTILGLGRSLQAQSSARVGLA
jgi:putative transposase